MSRDKGCAVGLDLAYLLWHARHATLALGASTPARDTATRAQAQGARGPTHLRRPTLLPTRLLVGAHTPGVRGIMSHSPSQWAVTLAHSMPQPRPRYEWSDFLACCLPVVWASDDMRRLFARCALVAWVSTIIIKDSHCNACVAQTSNLTSKTQRWP